MATRIVDRHLGGPLPSVRRLARIRGEGDRYERGAEGRVGPVGELLNPDGTLNLATGYNGALDINDPVTRLAIAIAHDAKLPQKAATDALHIGNAEIRNVLAAVAQKIA